MIPAVHAESHLPILVDPSHGTGILYMIEPMSLSAVAAGADGLEIEVHIDPSTAMSDKDQQLTPDAFKVFMRHIREMRAFMAEQAMADADALKRGDPVVREGIVGSTRDPFADAMD